MTDPAATRFLGSHEYLEEDDIEGQEAVNYLKQNGDIHNISSCHEYAIVGYWQESEDMTGDKVECYKMFQIRDPLKINYVSTHESKKLYQVLF